jgi:hypothetical protein
LELLRLIPGVGASWSVELRLIPGVGTSCDVENLLVGGRCRNCADSSPVRTLRSPAADGILVKLGVEWFSFGGSAAGTRDEPGYLETHSRVQTLSRVV